MAKKKDTNSNDTNVGGESFSPQMTSAQPVGAQQVAATEQGSKRLGVGGIIGIAAAGVVVLLGTAFAGGVAGAAIALNGFDDRPGFEQVAEGHGPGGEKRGQFPGDRDGMTDGMRGGHEHDWDDDDPYDARVDENGSDWQRGPGGQQLGGMQRNGMNCDADQNTPPRPDAAPDTTSGAS